MSDEIKETDLELVHQTLTEAKEFKSEVSHFDPSQEMENSLALLMRHQIMKLQKEDEFGDCVKDAIRSRLPEADFRDLVHLSLSHQTNLTLMVEKILAPFVPKVGERVPLLDGERGRGRKPIDERVFDHAPKDVLQGLGDLAKAIAMSKKNQSEK